MSTPNSDTMKATPYINRMPKVAPTIALVIRGVTRRIRRPYRASIAMNTPAVPRMAWMTMPLNWAS